MKICILSSGHTIDDSRVFHKEINSLKKSCSNICLVCPHNEKYFEHNGIRIFGIRKRKSRYNRFDTLLDLYKIGLKVKADVYHCHEPDSLFIGWILKQKLGSKLIYDCHEFHPQAFSENLPPYIRHLINFIVEKLENALAAQCDFIFTVNDFLVNRFQKYCRNVLLLPNYPVLQNKPKPKLDGRDKELVYIGGLSEENGIGEIIKSISILKQDNFDVKLTLIGEFTDKAFKQKILSFINDNQLNSNLAFTGCIHHLDALDILAKKSVGMSVIQPKNDRQINCQPIKLFEYMASGNCIVASSFPMIKSIVQRYNCGVLVNPENPYEIAAAVKQIFNDSTKLRNFMGNSRSAAENEYNWESLENKLFETYSSLETKSGGI